jgi:hypothetical protein
MIVVDLIVVTIVVQVAVVDQEKDNSYDQHQLSKTTI